MANQKIHLSRVYAFVIKHKTVSLRTLVNHFNTTTKQLLQQLSTLQSMGLSLQIESDSIKLTHCVSPIDIQHIQTKLNLPINYTFSTESTNTLARKSTNDSIFICEHQSLGRGQRGKKWLSPLGHCIALSITQSFDFAFTHLSGLNIAIGVAVIKSINQFSNNQVSLKWPNDVIGKDGKIAGILIEAQGDKNSCTACIGIGINWNLTKDQLATIDQPCMNAKIETISRTKFIIYLLNEITSIVEEFKVNQLKRIIAQWQKYDLLRNQIIRVNTPTNSYRAKYIEVDISGLLIIETKNEKKLISSASIQITKFGSLLGF